VRNATNSGQCRWCGKLFSQQQPQNQQPVPYQSQPVYHPPQSPPVYYPQQQSGPVAGYPIQPSFVNDLRAMGGREAAKLTFGASIGAGAGWGIGRTIGRFAGCLIILLIIFIAMILIGVIASPFARNSAPATSANGAATGTRVNQEREEFQNSFDSAARRNCVTTAEETSNLSPVMANSYCQCALSELKATGSIQQAREICTAEVLQSATQQDAPPQ
jgi:predicted lipid-binding transport protein (Tim44 family)